MIYENKTEWVHRVLNTVIKVGGSFVYVAKVFGTEDKPSLYVNHLPNLIDYKSIECSREDIDVTPFPLGFVNLKDGTCTYYWRSPNRNQLQGLSQESLSGLVILENRLVLSLDRLISKQEFVDCIGGKYPSLKEVLKTLDTEDEDASKVLAFDRKFAVTKDEDCGIYVLFYKTRRAGHSINGKKWVIGTTFSYIREQAKERGLDVKD